MLTMPCNHDGLKPRYGTFGADSPKRQIIKGSAVFDFYKQGKILLGYCLRRQRYDIFQRIQACMCFRTPG